MSDDIAKLDDSAATLVRTYATKGRFCLVMHVDNSGTGRLKLIYPQGNAAHIAALLDRAANVVFDGPTEKNKDLN